MSRSPDIDKLVEDLARLCAICKDEEHTDLRLYPCQHFGCSWCIDRLKGANSQFYCPECGKLVTVSPEGLPLHREAVRTNEQYKKLSEALTIKHNPPKETNIVGAKHITDAEQANPYFADKDYQVPIKEFPENNFFDKEPSTSGKELKHDSLTSINLNQQQDKIGIAAHSHSQICIATSEFDKILEKSSESPTVNNKELQLPETYIDDEVNAYLRMHPGNIHRPQRPSSEDALSGVEQPVSPYPAVTSKADTRDPVQGGQGRDDDNSSRITVSDDVSLADDRQDVDMPHDEELGLIIRDCKTLVEEDQQCVMEFHCHESCCACWRSIPRIAREAIPTTGNIEGPAKLRRLVLLPCWILCFVKVLRPCCAVFNPRQRVGSELEGVSQMREKARKAFLEVQKPNFVYCTKSALHIFMIFFSILEGFFIYSTTGYLPLVWRVTLTIIDSLRIFLWLTFMIINRMYYEPDDNHPVIRDGNFVTYFTMELIQQFLFEFTLYPSLFISLAVQSFGSDIYIFFLGQSIFHAVLLLSVFLLRLVTIIKIRHFVIQYFRRLIYLFIGNSLITVYLVGVFAYTSYTINSHSSLSRELTFDAPLQLGLVFLVFFNNICNYYMFYVSHLYEVSLQAGLNLLSLNAAPPHDVRPRLEELTGLETFHKNMYTMSSPGYGTLVYFWIFPSFAVWLIFLITALYNGERWSHFYFVCGYCCLLCVVNYKTFLLSSAAHFTCFTVVMGIIVICFLSIISFPFAVLFGLALIFRMCCYIADLNRAYY